MKIRKHLSRRTWVGLAGAAVLALVLGVPQFKAAPPVPERLTDEAFWQIIEEFSEDGGNFTSENFSSNERGYETLIPKLAARLAPGGVYLGVGPEQNFQYIASLKPKLAFIIDIRRQNMIQHLMYKAAFEMAANRSEFLSIVFSRRRPQLPEGEITTSQLFNAYLALPRDLALADENRQAIKTLLLENHGFKLTLDDQRTLDHVFDVFAAYGPTINYSANIDGMGRMIQRTGGNNVAYAELMQLVDSQGVNRSYLASEESFLFVKDLQARNLIVPVVGNFGGPKAIRSVGQYLKDHGAALSVFYLSNVEQYLFSPPQGGPPIFREFYENVATLPISESSTFIRSGNPAGGRGGGLTPMMSSVQNVLEAFREGRINNQRDVLLLSAN